MCWDGNNPPHKKMTPQVLEKLATQIATDLSVITPHDGSEPTIVTWNETVRIARDYSVQLALTTNAQLFDEHKFDEVKDFVEMIVLSIDSHVPEVFEKIRPGAKAAMVYENAERTARLCDKHRIECIVQTVFMTENAPMMPETVAWAADIGATVFNVIQMIDVNRRSWHLDATMHFSAEYLDWIKQQCLAVARERGMLLGWFLRDPEWFDFREQDVKVPVRESKAWNDSWDERMKLRHPGFCKYAYDRLRITADGDISPCGLDGDNELRLGTLADQDFDQIWNGATAQDLRRAHYTWDHPTLCATCRFVNRVPAKEALPFLDNFLMQTWGVERPDVEPTLEVTEPAHMCRQTEAPVLRVTAFPEQATCYTLVLSLGGWLEEISSIECEPTELRDETIALEVPEQLWNGLRSNVGYWWNVIATRDGRPLARGAEVRCLIRHEALPRIDGSTLRYPDGGQFAITYLGGDRQLGWSDRGDLPSRPPLRERHEQRGRRFADRRTVPDGALANGRVSPEAYVELIGQIRDVVRSALPEAATVLVASKGDDELLQLAGREGRHFPSDADGAYLGFHPPDDEWAVGHLERKRGAGADFLLLPATSHWWLDHYAGLADHLNRRYTAIVEDRDRCTIFDLREPAAVVR